MVKCAAHCIGINIPNISSMECLVYINGLEATSVVKVVYLMAKKPSSDLGISK